MIYQEKGVAWQQKGVIWQRQGVILVVVNSKRCDMRGNLIPGQFSAGLDGLAAMDRRNQHHQRWICSGIARVWPLRQYNMKVQEKLSASDTFK